MSKPTPPKDLWQRLADAERELRTGQDIRPGPEWFTREEYKERGGTDHRLKRLRKAGRLESRHLPSSMGGRLNYYRLKEDK